MVLQVEEVDHLSTFSRACHLRAAPGAVNNISSTEPVRRCVAPDQQVLQHAGVLEQLDVLERAGDAQRRHRVRRLRQQVRRRSMDAPVGV